MKLTRNIQAITLENHILQQIAPLRIHVYSCNDAELTFEYLSRTYQDIECLHIFCTQFAKKNIIAKIFQRFRNLKEISFNCNHQFREEHIANLPLTQLKKIQKLELKWSSDTFFNEFYRYHYFQSKEWNSLQRQNEVKINLDTLDKLQRNCTIWIPNQTVAKEIKR